MIIAGNRSTGEITVDGKRLDPQISQKVWNHSPTGFAWGYGSDSAQLALALLLHAGVPEDVALKKHQELKQSFVARLSPKYSFVAELHISPDGTWIQT